MSLHYLQIILFWDKSWDENENQDGLVFRIPTVKNMAAALSLTAKLKCLLWTGIEKQCPSTKSKEYLCLKVLTTCQCPSHDKILINLKNYI